MWLLQQGGNVDGPGVASRPPHDETHRPRVAGIGMHILDLQRGWQKNVVRRRSNNLLQRRCSDVMAVFSATNWNTARTSCWNVAGTSPGGERRAIFEPYWPLWHAEEGDTRTRVSAYSFRAATASTP